MEMRAPTDWLLTPWRVAVHLPTATAVVADLHLGYDLARWRSGEAVPPARLDELLAPLQAALNQTRARSLVIAGDLFEVAYEPELAEGLLAWVGRQGVLLAAVIPGNHDRGLDQASSLPLQPGRFTLGRWHVVHGDGRLPDGPVVCGHWHPCLRWPGLPAAPCYLHKPDRLVLPAYSTDAAGVNVLGSAHWRGYRCTVIAGERILDFGEVTVLQQKRRTSRRS